MNRPLPPKFKIIPIAIILILCIGFFFAQQVKAASLSKDDVDGLAQQARNYREEGFKLQSLGNLPAAMSFYQKAIAVDPGYAMAYNDLGIIYEAMGSFALAEENYLKSMRIDPSFSSVYANLALLYEGQRNLEQAAFYWGKRIETGNLDDPWTQKAINRLKDIRAVLSNRPFFDQREEEEVLSLVKDESVRKAVFAKDDKLCARDRLGKAKLSYKRGDLATAIKEALDAQHLDQDNPEIDEFIEKAERRALTR